MRIIARSSPTFCGFYHPNASLPLKQKKTAICHDLTSTHEKQNSRCIWCLRFLFSLLTILGCPLFLFPCFYTLVSESDNDACSKIQCLHFSGEVFNQVSPAHVGEDSVESVTSRGWFFVVCLSPLFWMVATQIFLEFSSRILGKMNPFWLIPKNPDPSRSNRMFWVPIPSEKNRNVGLIPFLGHTNGSLGWRKTTTYWIHGTWWYILPAFICNKKSSEFMSCM